MVVKKNNREKFPIDTTDFITLRRERLSNIMFEYAISWMLVFRTMDRPEGSLQILGMVVQFNPFILIFWGLLENKLEKALKLQIWDLKSANFFGTDSRIQYNHYRRLTS